MHPTMDDLLALRDGDGPAEAARHVEHCPECSDRIDELRAAASALRALPPVVVNRDHWSDIRHHIVGRRRTLRAIRMCAAAAVLVAAVSTVVLTRAPVTPTPGVEVSPRMAIDELAAASRGLEELLRDPALRNQILSPRRAALIVDLEDRIAAVDVALADPPVDWGVERDVVLWSHRVELLDALVAARTRSLGEQDVAYAVIQYEGSQQ